MMTDRPDQTRPETARRRPLVAGLLSFLAAGLGQVYNGQPGKGVLFGLASFAGIYLYFLTGLWRTFPGLVGGIILGVVFQFWVIVDAARTAARLKDYRPRKYNTAPVYLAVALVFLAGHSLERRYIRDSFCEVYTIPAGSMAPALIPGDLIMTDRTAAALADLSRGDLVVFPNPENPAIKFAKRIIGLPGERVLISDKLVFINGRRLNEPYANFELRTDLAPESRPPRDFGPQTVPTGRLFVLGDSRDNSNDSRFIGPIERTDLIGKIIYVVGSVDRASGSIRWGRFGHPVGAEGEAD